MKMRSKRSLQALFAVGLVSAGSEAIVAANAQLQPPPPKANELQVYLVRQDFSDCVNGNVPNVNSPSVGGNLWLTRQSDGNTSVTVALTASPDATYHFYLKCVRQLGDIKTDDYGQANVTFTFPTNSVGNVYAFDSYPEGAPAGNKFQSAQVKFQ
jgi:hypothetical protein